MSARQARRILAPMLSPIRGLEHLQRIAFRVVENSRGDFVFGTMLSWDAPTNSNGTSAGFHSGVDDADAAEEMFAAFLEMVLDRLPDGVLVHDGIGQMLKLLARHRSLPEARAMLRHIERALDIGMDNKRARIGNAADCELHSFGRFRDDVSRPRSRRHHLERCCALNRQTPR